ncbi:helix-turn-helix domain-containing protein [Microbacterium sp. RD1]|uniref:helix-turn-helix domain-containing protein n=1 Tax=Microbacterium sp. RD1 TaxID=3457313 RepID=UPI003FA60291
MSTTPTSTVDSTTEVVTSSAVELVCRLYVATHVSSGDFEQLPRKLADDAEDDALRPVLQRYFGADFSVGMSLNSLALSRGWWTAADLAAGVRALAPEELVAALLASTTLEEVDRRTTATLVDEALRDPEARLAAAKKIARRNAYARPDVEYLLEDPARVKHELAQLLTQQADALDEDAIARALADRAGATTDLLVAEGRERALLALTGGWTLRDESQPLVLIPTDSLGPLVITRLLPDGRITVAFGRPPERSGELSADDVAAIARALSSEQRVAILQHIGREPASGQTLAKALKLTQATVHYHTAMLRSSGLVTSTRDAHSVLHALDRDRILLLLGGIGRLLLDDPTVEVGRRLS